MEIRLEAYNVSSKARVSANDIVFGTGANDIELPRRLDKTVKREWRIRHTGRRALPKAKDRRRQTTEYTIEGAIMNRTNRDKLDYLSRQNVYFKLIIKYGTSDSETDFNSYGHVDSNGEIITQPTGSWSTATKEDVYVIIDSFKSWMPEAKRQYYEYSLTLKRINPNKIA